MKLLIVDDEDTTREGIVEKLPWKDIGIDQVEQADDGINALVVAYELSPDIVLTDVRMPRMDGVEMSFRIREKFPQCKIIFMSGYSDKEYLKCAIKLKAISYIEKPINLLELRSALETAVAVCVEEKRRYENEQELNHRLNAGIPLIRSELALLLTHPAVQTVQLVENLKLACLSLPIGGFYTTLLIKFLWCENYSPLEIHTMRESIPAHLENAYLESGLQGLSGMKSEDILLIHLYADISEKHLMTSDKVHNFCQNLYDALKGTGRIFICIGKKVQTITNVYYSYNTAVLAFQRTFFRSSGSFVEYDDNTTPPYEFNTQLILTFGELLDNDNMEQSIFLIKRLTSELKRQESTLVVSVKNFYFRLLLELEKSARQHDIKILSDLDGENELWEHLLKLNTLTEVESFITHRLETYYRLLKTRLEACDPIVKINRYIQSSYADESLSINKISEHIHLSPSHMCFLFKDKTGKTLNQFLTEFRMEKARELLCKKEYKVSDIAVKVGYSDSNYFTKIFRKWTGLTPTEYRGRYLR